MTTSERLAAGDAALAEGRWDEARAAFASALAEDETASARFGLAVALWWSGESQACVEEAERAYALFRRSGEDADAARCATWLAITYTSNFANAAAAGGWLARAERLLAPLPTGPLHGWAWVARAHRLADLATAEELSARAVEVARRAGDVDLELVALAQLGHVRVGLGDTAAGFTLLDEAVAASLGGERSTLDTVVYTCCDMLNACELAGDLERAAQWCRVADGFVSTYGCPFLYAECRICYGSLLAAGGRWDDGARELLAGLRLTAGACPGLHTRALVRLAALRTRQGRLEEAEQLLAGLPAASEAAGEEALSVAALLLARGDAPGAVRVLEQRSDDLGTQAHLVAALDLLVDAHLSAGELEAAGAAAQRLDALARSGAVDRVAATAASARGRVAAARGDADVAARHLGTALEAWTRLQLPFEQARARSDLARAVAVERPALAVDHARRALGAFEALGASLDADRVAALLRSLGIRTRTGARAGGPLSPREQEVLRLLEEGLTNPEIAARLLVSRKTASHHVSSILTKLQLRNRAEAAAYAARAHAAPLDRSHRR